MSTVKTIKTIITKSKRGLPCLWEEGGGYSNTGEVQIIASSDGKPKKPIYVRRSGTLACAQHALIVVERGDYVIRASHHRRDFNIIVYSIADIFDEFRKEFFPGEHIETITREEFLRRYGEFGQLDNAPVSSVGCRLAEPGILACGSDSSLYYDIAKLEERMVTYSYALLEKRFEFSCGEWDDEPTFLLPAIEAAKEKALCYHCRAPHYIRED